MPDNKALAKSGPSWGTVIVLLILFWPVGLFFLYKKLTSDKTAILRNSQVLSIYGWVLAVIGILYVILGVASSARETQDMAATIGAASFILLFFVGGGFLMIAKANKMKKTGNKYKRYIDAVANQRLTSIDQIAAVIPVQYEEAASDLQKMIDIGYFEIAYIDMARRELIMPARQPVYSASASAPGAGARATKAVRCKSCGANNTIVVGAANECEFCGSPLE